ncbi:hypothetical protein DM860_011411 [Cuscuta australis]|uniref:Uncharacterized protein n=1 Tax=Cuscuta australis TaxID=267555 RepID=A0A328DQZ1_9ASTE|nr:hypothetical protein DM860_011411 [Cuscuta australis]
MSLTPLLPPSSVLSFPSLHHHNLLLPLLLNAATIYIVAATNTATVGTIAVIATAIYRSHAHLLRMLPPSPPFFALNVRIYSHCRHHNAMVLLLREKAFNSNTMSTKATMSKTIMHTDKPVIA